MRSEFLSGGIVIYFQVVLVFGFDLAIKTNVLVG